MSYYMAKKHRDENTTVSLIYVCRSTNMLLTRRADTVMSFIVLTSATGHVALAGVYY